MAENSEEAPLSVVISIWTGAIIWVILMTAFKWWRAWWAYIPLVGIMSGAIQRTANYFHQRNIQESTTNLNQPRSDSTFEQVPEGEHSPVRDTKFCSNCGAEIPIDASKCSNCGSRP